jgi:hypothetical protein
MVLGLEANQWVAIIVGIVCVAALVIIVAAPWRRIRAERPLSEEAQTRLLLGDNPADIAQDEERSEASKPSSPRADVFDLNPERRSSA